jgi:hypothetical protein
MHMAPSIDNVWIKSGEPRLYDQYRFLWASAFIYESGEQYRFLWASGFIYKSGEQYRFLEASGFIYK